VINVGLLPSGTTATLIVRKSTSVGGPFVDSGTFSLSNGINTISLATVTTPLQRFTRLVIRMTNTGNRAASPEVISLRLNWTITTTIYSSVIDTGATPAGWNIFQASSTLNGGSVSYGIRSASTSIQLTDDVPGGPFVPAFTSISNGVIPTIAVNPFVQWCVQIVSNPDQVPIVDSITVNWFINLVSSVRAASLFIDQEYYCSLATANSLVNDIILKLDRNGNWRVWRDQQVGALSYFFTDAFFADAATARVYKFLQGDTDHGNAIEMDVRLKAFDFEDQTKLKSLRQVFAVFDNTGATFDVSYSFDEGKTFLPLQDAAGATTFTLPTNNLTTSKRLVPLASYQNQGKTILVRLHENSVNKARIQEVQLDAYVRQGDVING
jgi:hypothetical protein